MECKDQLGNFIKLQDKPSKIVSLVPSLTELLVDLGLEKKLVGVTKFCVHPNYIRKTKTVVGGTKNIKFSDLKKLNPDFILCNKEENTKEIVFHCQKITTTYVSDIYTFTDFFNLIDDLSMLLGCENKGKALILEFKNKINAFQPIKNKVKVAYFIWKNPWMVAGKNTFINYLLKFNGFYNLYSNQSRYPEISLDNLKNVENLQYVFLSSEPYPFKEEHVKSLENLMPNTKIILVNGEYFSWYGTRLLKAFDYFKALQKLLQG